MISKQGQVQAEQHAQHLTSRARSLVPGDPEAAAMIFAEAAREYQRLATSCRSAARSDIYRKKSSQLRELSQKHL